MLTTKQSFIAGFLQKCAEDGLTPEETVERVRSANELIKSSTFADKVLALIGGLGSGVVQASPKLLLGGGLAAGGLAAGTGGVGGLMLGQAGDLSDVTPEEVQMSDKAQEYRRLAQVAKLRKELKDKTRVPTRGRGLL